jgi:hypothetical protein
MPASRPPPAERARELVRYDSFPATRKCVRNGPSRPPRVQVSPPYTRRCARARAESLRMIGIPMIGPEEFPLLPLRRSGATRKLPSGVTGGCASPGKACPTAADLARSFL